MGWTRSTHWGDDKYVHNFSRKTLVMTLFDGLGVGGSVIVRGKL